MRFMKGSKGFTLMELMVVVAILGVLMAIVAPAVTGTKGASVEGQVKSDAKSVQTSVDNFNNKSIRTGAFPEVKPDAANHIYSDLWSSTNSGVNLTFKDKDGIAKDAPNLNSKVQPSGTTGDPAKVFARRLIDYDAQTDTYDASGAVKTAGLVPDFLQKVPSSLPLKADETKNLGSTDNTVEEYLWVMLVNAPCYDQESRTVEVYKLTAGTCTMAGTPAVLACTNLEYTQIF